MLRRALLFALLAFSTPLTAQHLVKTGDHGAFTRVVLPTANPERIKAEKIGPAIVVSGDPNIKNLDLSELFSQIDKSRVTSIAIDEKKSSAIINLACDCTVTSSVLNNGYLVIDVSDARQRSAPLKGIGKDYFGLGLQKNLGRSRTSASKQAASQSNLPNLRRVLEQGVTEAVRTGSLNETDLKRDRSAAREWASSNDHEQKQRAAPRSQFNISKECGQASTIFHAKAPEEAAEYISAARRDIARDTESSEGTEKKNLARAYLALGFGAEARAIIRGTDHPDRALLALSYILDTGDDRLEYFSRLSECDQQIAYWSIFSSKANLKNLNTRAILEAIQQLPEGMLRATGNTALAKLEARAEPSTYDAIRAPLERRLEHWTLETPPQKDGSSAATHHLSADPKRTLLADFLKKVSSDYETGRAVSDDDLQLLSGYQREYSNDRQSWLNIGKAKAVSMLSRDNVSGAYEVISTMRGELETKVYEEYLNKAAKALVSISDPFDFLETAFPIIARDADHLSLNHQLIISERLIEHDMLGLAQSIVDTWRKPYRSEEQYILLAKLSQRQNKPLAARSQIAGLSSQPALRAMASIDMDLGYYQEAKKHFTQSKNPERAAHAHWLSGGMPESLPNEPKLLRLSRNLAQQASTDALETLEERKALLSEAEAQSHAIEQLLALSIDE